MNESEREQQGKERQWDREMAQVDKLLAKLPTYQAAPPPQPLGGDPTIRRPAYGGGAGTAAGMWGRVVLGLVLAAGVTVWPYTHGCGLELMFYLAGVAMVVVAGVWSAHSSWRRHSGMAHVLSLIVLIWGLVLAAQAVLPRVGHAEPAAAWLCSADG